MPKVFAGILFSLGFIFLAVTVSVAFTKNPTAEDKSAALGGLIIGVPATAGGAWIVWGLRKKNQYSQSDRLEQLERTFLELVDSNDGKVTALKFAIATKLSLEEAKIYLDQKAVMLNATFEVSEEGGINYRFHLD
ncbi:hypothetical protein Syn7502_03378 [Synechococcus sp. PCC 7502]|uniref:hypothetical protein n=1 Tax=Synechococcus sp. PCC 7502 TaxID=1173263 RepID=UPI00029FC7ED|nr:hypothetical protein [Synechococcus sp. PCC 7502]AFY75231.1 hypothetical protein Syn7502_03378 [Synechococcus sp. PCC 7502]